MTPVMFPEFLVLTPSLVLVFPLVLTSPVLVEQTGLIGCQCSPDPATKVELTAGAGAHLVILLDIAGSLRLSRHHGRPLVLCRPSVQFLSRPQRSSQPALVIRGLHQYSLLR